VCFLADTKSPCVILRSQRRWYHQDGKGVELVLQLDMTYFGIMKGDKLLLQWKEELAVKLLQSVKCSVQRCSFQHLEHTETLMLCSSYDLEVSLLCQISESSKHACGLRISKNENVIFL
jgi:hypothetical protein